MSRSKPTNKNELPQQLSSLPAGSLHVLQLSDPHLFSDPNGHLLGLNTLNTLNQVLELVGKTLASLDFALVTGDLVHDASPTGYARLQERLATLGVPTYCIPGNHDSPKVLAKSLGGNPAGLPGSVIHGNWQLVLLDSKEEGTESGLLDDSELEKLESALAENPDKHALICLHHNPVPVGSAWLDTMQLQNADAFFEVINRHPHVKGIVWGHVHQSFEDRHREITLLGTPSTCFQFAPRTKDFGLDEKPPGCRWLALLPNGEIKTGVIHLEDMPENLDRSSSGY